MGKFETGSALHDAINKKLEEVDKGITDDSTTDEEIVIDDNDSEAVLDDSSDDTTDANADTPDGDLEENDSNDSVNDTADGNGDDNESSEGEFFEVKVGGKTVKVTMEELLNGFMMNADYTQKTQELSRLKVEAQEIIRNRAFSPQQKEEPEIEVDEEFQLDDFADDNTKKLVELRRADKQRLAVMESQLRELNKSSQTSKGKAKLQALRDRFEMDENLHGIPKKYFTPVAVYKRVGEMLPDPTGKPYGERYTLEMAIADVKGDIGDLLSSNKSLPAEGSETYEKMKADIIEDYLKKKKDINKKTFSPSNGGSKVPITKKKFKSPQDALAHIKESI